MQAGARIVGVRNMSNTFDKLSVLDSFIEEVNSYLPEIEANLEHLAQSAQAAQSPGDMDALEETHRRTHTIGGSASMMDFPGIAHVAHGMEDILSDALEGVVTLDSPTVSLLQRSLGRLYLLVDGIRNGIDEDAVIAEDDADYAGYRASFEAEELAQQTQATRHEDLIESSASGLNVAASAGEYQPEEIEPPLSGSMPSFDEVLASFRTSPASSSEDTAWPEEPAIPESAPVLSQEKVASSMPQSAVPSEDEQIALLPSALDTLVASTRQLPTLSEDAPTENEVEVHADASPIANINDLTPISVSSSPSETKEIALPKAYEDVQNDTQALETYASSLKNISSQLRSAMAVIEAQRGEFRGFLDGSKDALDRMEDWAGKAMGLDLRNSNEQVRRYLPLSVVWVANSKLKKVLELLNQVTSGVELTDEQMQTVLQQLHTSLTDCGEAFQRMQIDGTRVLKQEPGWTPWEMQVERDAQRDVQERVTFERRGNPDALRTEIEANVREELRREYESGSNVSLAVRAELEQKIRNEVRQEFEARQRLQERTSISGIDELRRELEAQLRNEIEIQVRQEFLTQIATNEDSASPRTSLPSSPAPTLSNFAERAWQATGAVGRDEQNIHANASSIVSSTSPNSITSVAPTTPVPPSQAQTASVAATDKSAQPPASASSAPSSFSGDFGEEAAEIFRLEAEEHLQTISTYVAALEREPENRELIQGIRRATHTLKGAAGMMGFRAIAELSHISEDLLDSIMEGTISASPAALSIILDTAETLDVLITGKGADEIPDEARVQTLRVRYAALLNEHNISQSVSSEEYIDVEAEGSEEPITDTALVAGVGTNRQSETNAQRANRNDLSVRVRLQKLDELVNLFGEVLVNRSVLEERIERLVRLVADVGISSNRLRDVGQKLESRFEAATLPSGRSVMVMPGEGNSSPALVYRNGKNGIEPSHLKDFDELELDRYTEFHQLARGLSEGISDMATLSTEMDAIIRECEGVFARENRLNTTFQDRLLKTRLVPLSTMTPRLYRAARAVAFKQHKDFEFMLEGEETEVDRTVFEEIAGPLLHLMRNAVNHAIETPEVRTEHGKSPKGQITLSASYEGNQVVITVRDDGRGIDPEHVRNVAIAHGLIQPDHILSENELIELIFRPGFSTAEVLSEESGRGVGLDVVRDSVSRLRGSIEVESTPGQGTAFTMKFPTSMAIQSAMMVRVSNQQFAIPIVMVESIGRLDTFKRTTVAGQPAVVVRNDLYPLSMLAQYLSLPPGQIGEKSHILLVNAGGNRVALVIDEVKGKSDVVIKNLGPHLRHVHGIAGGTVLGNGQVVLILELTELLSNRAKLVTNVAGNAATSARSETTATSIPQMPQTPPLPVRQTVEVSPTAQTGAFAKVPASSAPKLEHGKHILVVDDSPSVRRVVGNMLKQHGWEVQMARDGVEALEMITRETPAAVLLDIEMPRMDGYELIATLRAQEQYRTLPLVMLTSRAAAKHQQRAMQLGASGYVVKPYQDEELLSTLNNLVYGTVVR